MPLELFPAMTTTDIGYGQVARSGRIWCLAIAETVIWAGTFYLFPALLAHWETDLGWSKTELTAGFTTTLVVAALTAPYAGRLIDMGRGRAMMTICSALAAALLVALAFVDDQVQFFAIWVALGLLMAGALYEACFAFLTRTRGADARRAITLVTLVAGFAGTLSFPVNNFVADAFGWRASALTFAALIACVATPLFWIGAAGDTRPQAVDTSMSRVSALRVALRRPAFWYIALAFALLYLNHGMVVTHLLPLLAERKLPLKYAVLAASLIGPMQVAGRVAMVAVERRMSMNAITVATFASVTCASIFLFASAWHPLLLGGFALCQGAGIGVTSIARPVVTANLLGRESFGQISGSIALFQMGATAVAPTIGGLLWSIAGYDLVLVVAGVEAFCGLLCFLLAARQRG